MRLPVLFTLSVLLMAILLAPWLAAAASPLAAGIYAAFSWVCHQQPERSFRLGEFPLAVCARCLGVYAGALAGALLRRPASLRLLLMAALLGALDWAAEAAGWMGPRPFTRIIIGFVFGFLLASSLLREHSRSAARNPWRRIEVRG